MVSTTSAGPTGLFATHKVRWTVGSNILSSWRYETEDEQRERWEVVADYEDIEDGSLPEGVWSRDPVARNKELDPLGVFVDHLKITCTKEGVTLDDGLPF
jgi:hypothetical protein